MCGRERASLPVLKNCGRKLAAKRPDRLAHKLAHKKKVAPGASGPTLPPSPALSAEYLALPMATATAKELDAFWQGAAPGARERYVDLTIIGSGAYSVVARALDVKMGAAVAIKRIAEVFYDANEAKKVLREIRLLRDFKHPNVITLHALIPPVSLETFDDIFMVTDFMESDLRRVIKSRRSQLKPEQVRSYMTQLLAGMHHVHTHSGIHRDLKPANILVSPSVRTPAAPYGLLRLCDFGLARVDTCVAETKREQNAATQIDNEDDQDDDDDDPAGTGGGSSGGVPQQQQPATPPSLKKQMTYYVVTRWYRAPEVILRESYSAAIDLWAVGCIFKELLELQPESRFRTGALFPGRYCIPFSFDDDQRERQKHDQLAVIATRLGEPTAAEMAWAGAAAQAEALKVCTAGAFSSLSPEERAAEVDAKLAEACPVVGEAEKALLKALLEWDPARRPNAAEALRYSYFDDLPDVEKPAITPSPDPAQIEEAFAFENEQLGTNELRILLANDLFRMEVEEGKESAGAAATSVA